MGLKMAAEVSRTDAFYNLGSKIHPIKITQLQQDIVFSSDLYIIMILKICTCIFLKNISLNIFENMHLICTIIYK